MAKRSRLALPRDEYLKLVDDCHKRDRRRCRVCKCRTNLHAHHVVYRSQGGDDILSNLLTVCDNCHSAIHFTGGKRGQGLIVISRGKGNEPITSRSGPFDAGDLEDIGFIFVNGWTPRRKAA